MIRKTLISGALALLLGAPAFSQSMQTKEDSNMTLVEVKTTVGDFTLGLYDDTPLHRDNFLRLARAGYYDGVTFHRVIKDFMVQGGDHETRPGRQVKDVDATLAEVPAEFVYPRHFHRRGVLAAARQGDQVNPERRSSESQFYIVTGRKFTPEQLRQMEHNVDQDRMQQIFNGFAREYKDSIMAMRRARDIEGLQRLQEELAEKTRCEAAAHPFRFTPEQVEAYTTVGGAPHLDGAYTVYGEVVSGMDVVEKIENAATDAADKPLEDIRILSMTVVDPKRR